MYEAFRQTKSLLHSARQSLDERVSFDCQVGKFEYAINDLLSFAGRNFVNGGKEIEILPNLYVIVKAEEIRHVADLAANFHRVLPNIGSVNARGTGGRLE